MLVVILKHHSNAIICNYIQIQTYIEGILGGNITPEEPNEGTVTAIVKVMLPMLIANLKHH